MAEEASGRRRFAATLERHRPDLPVYLLVPAAAVESFGATGTFVVEATVEAAVEGGDIGRRSIKPWGDGRWFMELTKGQCAKLGVGEGDEITVVLRPAPAVPAELEARIATLDLGDRWRSLTEAERRAFCEPVFEARKPATREARVLRVIAALQGDRD